MAEDTHARTLIDIHGRRLDAVRSSINTLHAQVVASAFTQANVSMLSDLVADLSKRLLVAESEVRTLKAKLPQEGQGENVVSIGKSGS